MAKKYYAVKQGHSPGVYETWGECEKQVKGFSGASHKSFPTKAEAEEFIGLTSDKFENNIVDLQTNKPSDVIAYVDGSYEDSVKLFSYGLVIFHNGNELHFAEKYNTPDLIEMRNVAGEIMGAQKAMQYCIDNNIPSMDLYYDYEGIEKWCTSKWKANKAGTKAYKAFYDKIKSDLTVNFFKVTAHTGDEYNELADQLAKNAIKGFISPFENKENNMPSQTNIYLDRTSVDSFIEELGVKEWGKEFTVNPLQKIGNQYRCEFWIETNPENIDFYFRNDGTCTLKAIGNSIENASRLIELIENNSFKNKNKNATCTFNSISNESFLELISYLDSIEKLTKEANREVASPPHTHIKYKSNFGDSMVISYYPSTSKLMFQGSPAYIITEAMYFMTKQEGVSENEIIESQKEIYQSNDITVDEARAKLKARIPNAYEKLDDTILKILSPAISLSEANPTVEEYSCFVFPALKALEATLLDRLLNKQINLQPPQNFGSVFIPDQNNGRHAMKSSLATQISDSNYVTSLENIYNYFKQQRHAIFHANQILILTKMIFNKFEADAIINDVLDLIDKAGEYTYKA